MVHHQQSTFQNFKEDVRLCTIRDAHVCMSAIYLSPFILPAGGTVVHNRTSPCNTNVNNLKPDNSVKCDTRDDLPSSIVQHNYT